MNEKISRLAHFFLAMKNQKDMESLIQDIFTPSEIKQLNERWEIVALLLAGHTQRDVSKKLGLSISKVSRASQVIQYGQGSFQRIFKKK